MEHLGLVGLPDSGHAQLFSALTGIDTPTGFETTKGVAPLPDDRVDRLAEMSKSKKRIYGTFEIDFIPGLAPGGKAGEGLGSRLLGSLRDTDAVLAVVRAGDDADPTEALGALELDLVLADLGVSESVLPRLARSAYHLLGRRTFLTTGEDETRAWSFRAGAKAPECAGVIHSDLQRGFIRAEVIDWRELLDIGSWDKAKELGKLRVEGKEYEVLDGDVLEIRFNV